MTLLTQGPMTEKKGVAGTEGGRRPTGVSASGERLREDPEVLARPRRRTFSAEYRARIVKEADGCKRGELGALLRREGLYSSHLTLWRRQRDEGGLAGMLARKRGPKANPVNPRVKELERENAKLRRQLQRAECLLEIQKKAQQILKSLDEQEENG